MIGLGWMAGAMKKSEFTHEQITFALRHAETDAPQRAGMS